MSLPFKEIESFSKDLFGISDTRVETEIALQKIKIYILSIDYQSRRNYRELGNELVYLVILFTVG